jgi:hypothetical protein
MNACPALTGTTAQTVTLGTTHEVVFSNPVAAVVYLKFNWLAGDTEVSATNFDAMIPAGRTLNLSGAFTNVRMLCASSTSIGVIGS